MSLPKLTQEDIDAILEQRPEWVFDPDWDGAVYFPGELFELKEDASDLDVVMFETYGYSNSSWNWEFMELPQDDPLDEFGPLSLP